MILIINADDFGISTGVNRGIIQAHQAGVITSTSMMVRGSAVAEAAALARRNPRLGVGLHVDLCEWEYRDEEWRLRYSVVAMEDTEAVVREVGRQLDAFRALMRCDPTHIDSHQHVHKDEPVRTELLELTRKLGIPLRHFHPGIAYCGRFYGQSDKGYAFKEGISVESLLDIIRTLPPGATALVCHPAAAPDMDSAYKAERIVELKSLCDPRVRAAIRKSGVELRSFRDFDSGDRPCWSGSILQRDRLIRPGPPSMTDTLRMLTPIEERFCRENRIDKDLARGVKFDNSSLRPRIDPLWIQGEFDERPILEQIESVAIAKQSQFSNAIAKIYNAYCFAARWSIPKVYCGDLEILTEGAGLGSVSFFRGEPREKNYLKSRFFHNKTLADLCRGAPSRLQVLRSLVPYFRFAVPPPLASEEGHKDLYVHIRSGDVFRKEVPHFQYGQPPLSFYTKVLAYQKWERVFLVYEDQANPVIAALQERLRLLGMSWKAQSSDLKNDIEFLCMAKNLVVGRGTFIYPVLCVSPNIQRVFLFDEEPNYCFEDNQRTMWGLDKSSIEFITIRDETGVYRADILTRWTNSEEQRELMLTYDEKNLGVLEA